MSKVTMRDRKGNRLKKDRRNPKQEVIFDYEASTLVMAVMLKVGTKRIVLRAEDMARVANRCMQIEERDDGSAFFKIV